MWFPFVLLALPICLADLKDFRIPNVYLLLLSLLSLPIVLVNGVGRLSSILLAVAILIALSLVGLGMGDVKLLLIVAPTLNSAMDADLTLLATLIFLTASLHVLWQSLRNRSISQRIPLAPSIFAGLALYLATH
jgi:Flp pilus assembly protein protease CpaA